jgi:hypothetical protein
MRVYLPDKKHGGIRGIKSGGSAFFGERVGVPFFQPGRKKTLKNRLNEPFGSILSCLKPFFYYFRRFLAIFVISCRFWLIFYLIEDFLERVGGGTTFLAERVGGVP